MPPPEARAPKLLTQQELAAELRVSVRTLQRWRRQGYGPEAIQVGRSPRYQRSKVDRWLQRTSWPPR